MLDLVRTYDNVLSPQLSALLLDIPREQDGTRRKLGQTGFDEWLVPEELTPALLELQQELTQRYVDDCAICPEQWPAEYGYEAFRLKRYRPQTDDRFPAHVDVVNHETARRFLSFLFYVDAPAQGGETAFYEWLTGDAIPIEPKPGRCVVFPPLWPWLHAGRVSVGGKLILSGYWHYL